MNPYAISPSYKTLARHLAHELGGEANGMGGWIAPCPAHEGGVPSLSIHSLKGGGIFVDCSAGCSLRAIIEALRRLDLWLTTDGRFLRIAYRREA
jgi:hypothetical protein